MKKRSCLRCKILVTLPSGKQVESFLSVNLHKKDDSKPLADVVKAHLKEFHRLACERFNGNCTIKIVDPCELKQECG